MLYRYDGSFAGLLTLFVRCFRLGEEPTEIFSEEPAQGGLFAAPLQVATDPATARAFFALLHRRLGAGACRHLYHAFLAETPGRELTLYRYLVLGRRVGTRLDSCLTDETVRAVQRLARQVRGEAHRLKGLLRFRVLADGLLYAPVEPDGRVLSLLGAHFAARLAPELWLVHDLRRGEGLFGQGGEWLQAAVAADLPPPEAEEEAGWQALWRTFHREVAIAERRNPRLQRRFIPERYWRHLVELS